MSDPINDLNIESLILNKLGSDLPFAKNSAINSNAVLVNKLSLHFDLAKSKKSLIVQMLLGKLNLDGVFDVVSKLDAEKQGVLRVSKKVGIKGQI